MKLSFTLIITLALVLSASGKVKRGRLGRFTFAAVQSKMGDCVPVNHQYDHPGEVTCGCVSSEDPCLTDMGEHGPHCIPDKSCEGHESHEDSMSMGYDSHEYYDYDYDEDWIDNCGEEVNSTDACLGSGLQGFEVETCFWDCTNTVDADISTCEDFCMSAVDVCVNECLDQGICRDELYEEINCRLYDEDEDDTCQCTPPINSFLPGFTQVLKKSLRA